MLLPLANYVTLASGLNFRALNFLIIIRIIILWLSKLVNKLFIEYYMIDTLSGSGDKTLNQTNIITTLTEFIA